MKLPKTTTSVKKVGMKPNTPSKIKSAGKPGGNAGFKHIDRYMPDGHLPKKGWKE